MLRLLSVFILFSITLLTTGCGTMYLNAPTDQSVKLLPKSATTSVHIEKEVWFKWWGSQPIDAPDTATIIKQNQLKEVRLYMTNTLMDGIFNIFPGIIGFPRRTLIVEGNK